MRRCFAGVAGIVLATMLSAGGLSAGVLSANVAGTPARGAAAAQAETRNRLTLASQTSWVGPGEEMVLRLTVATRQPTDEVELAVAIYRRVMNRIEFTQTLQGRLRGVPITVTPPTPLSELTTDAAGAILVRLGVQDPAQPPDRARLRLADEGVYPIRVELRAKGGGTPLASLLTHLVYTTPPKEGGFPLKVALVLPIHATTALQPSGKRTLSPQTADAVSGLADSLQAYPLVPLTLLPTPETLHALQTSGRAADREALAGLAQVAEGRQTAGGAYVPIDVREFLQAGLVAEASAQLDRGARAVEDALSRRADPRTWVAAEPLDEESVLQLRLQQLDRFVIREADMEPLDLPITLAQPFELAVRSLRRPLVLSADRELSGHFSKSDDPVLAAHRLLADLSVIYGDLPSRSRAIVAMPPRSWRPDKEFLGALLAGISTSAILAGSTLEDSFAEVPPATSAARVPLVRRLAPVADNGSIPAGAIRRARSRLTAFTSIIDPANPLDDALEELVLAAEGSDVRASRRQAYLDGLNAGIDGQLSLIQVPPNRSITLTARTGEIPVTILSRAPYPVHLQLAVESEKLEFPDGSSRSINLTRRNTTERFSVRARTSGAFPLRLQLVSPEGDMVLGQSRFTVRSTAASGVGILLSAGAGAFLLLWWAHHHTQGRRNRRLVPV